MTFSMEISQGEWFYYIIDHQQPMRLLSHNLLACNVAKCDKNNFPLIIQVEKAVHQES